MQIELNAEELDLLIDWFDIMAELTGTKQEDDDLASKLTRLQADAAELEGLDLNDCGDACKL